MATGLDPFRRRLTRPHSWLTAATICTRHHVVWATRIEPQNRAWTPECATKSSNACWQCGTSLGTHWLPLQRTPATSQRSFPTSLLLLPLRLPPPPPLLPTSLPLLLLLRPLPALPLPRPLSLTPPSLSFLLASRSFRRLSPPPPSPLSSCLRPSRSSVFRLSSASPPLFSLRKLLPPLLLLPPPLPLPSPRSAPLFFPLCPPRGLPRSRLFSSSLACRSASTPLASVLPPPPPPPPPLGLLRSLPPHSSLPPSSPFRRRPLLQPLGRRPHCRPQRGLLDPRRPRDDDDQTFPPRRPLPRSSWISAWSLLRKNSTLQPPLVLPAHAGDQRQEEDQRLGPRNGGAWILGKQKSRRDADGRLGGQGLRTGLQDHLL